MKNAISWILVVLLATVIIIMWRCPDKVIPNRVEELEKQLAERETVFNRYQDSATGEILSRDSAITTLMDSKAVVSGELQKEKGRVSELTAKIRYAKVTRDTITYYVSCDSLVDLAESQSNTITRYEHISDSIIALHQKQEAAKDSLLNRRADLYSQLRSSFDTLAIENRELGRALNKEQKKNKIVKKIALAEGVAIVVLGVLIGLKK